MSTKNSIVNPSSLARPSGFSYAVISEGQRVVNFAGHTPLDLEGGIVGKGDIGTQFEQTLKNIEKTAKEANASLHDIVKMTVFVTDIKAYKADVKQIGGVYRRFFGSHYPAMTLVEVQRLWDEEAMIEIEAIAVLEVD